MDGEAACCVEAARAVRASVVLCLLVLEEDLVVFKLAIAVPAPRVERLDLLLFAHRGGFQPFNRATMGGDGCVGASTGRHVSAQISLGFQRPAPGTRHPPPFINHGFHTLPVPVSACMGRAHPELPSSHPRTVVRRGGMDGHSSVDVV